MFLEKIVMFDYFICNYFYELLLPANPVESGFIAGASFQLMHSPYWIQGVSSA